MILPIGLGLAAAIVMAPAVTEDSPAWNCYTMGNHECGVDTYVDSLMGERGAILPVANDGRVYISWEQGDVTHAAKRWRRIAWEVCVTYADGGDASLIACDGDYMEQGDDFKMGGKA